MLQNSKIKCLIVDDEPPAREIMKQHIAGVEALELVGACENAVEALSFLKDRQIDLLFLDIQMPQLLGTDFLRTLKSPPRVIFTTAFRKYALEGFDLDAVDFLLKPVSFQRFLKVVNKVLQVNLPSVAASPPLNENKESNNSFLYFRSDRKMVKVYFHDILFIEALKDYIKIVMPDHTVVTKYVLSTLAKLLPADEFLRIHRSFIVAINKIESFDTDFIQIRKHELPIGRLYKYDVNRVLKASSAD